MNCHRFFSLLFNSFPFIREYRCHRKLRKRRIKTCRRLKKDDPQHLRRYVMMSGVIRRL